MITDEDARRLLRARGVSPEWDDEINEDDGTGEDEGAGMTERAHERERERVPPPPLGRVPFNRLLLEAAAAAGLNVAERIPWEWQAPGIEAKMLAFQERARAFVPRQTLRGLPEGGWSGWTDGGSHYTGARILSWDEYAGVLEQNYYGPWRGAWVYGASAASEDRLLRALRRSVGRVFDPRTGEPCYPRVAGAITGGDKLARILRARDAGTVVWELRMGTGYGVEIPRRLTESRWMGFVRATWPSDALPWAVGGTGAAAAVLGAVGSYYPAWLLLVLLPLALAAFLGLYLNPYLGYRAYWLDEELTFGDLAREIAERNRREWERLQEEYGAPDRRTVG